MGFGARLEMYPSRLERLFRSSQQRAIPGDQRSTKERGNKASDADKRAQRQTGCGGGLATDHQSEAVSSGEDDSDEERKDRGPEAKEGRNHGEQLDVSQAKAVAMA